MCESSEKEEGERVGEAKKGPYLKNRRRAPNSKGVPNRKRRDSKRKIDLQKRKGGVLKRAKEYLPA